MNSVIGNRDQSKQPCGPGRPMCPELHCAVLEATNRLLETQAVGDLTINGIAKEAGVSRPAIYRRWSNVREIALEAFLTSTEQQIPMARTSSAAEMLRAQIRAIAKFMRGSGGRIVAELVGEGQKDPEVLAEFRDRFLTQRRLAGRAVIEKGIESGEFDASIDVEIAVDLYAGPIYYRLMTGHGKLTDAFACELAARVLRALAPQST
ncbi:MAG: TetR/AcrR family transcriptional regulator [Pseudomonadota bacterium]